MGDVRFRRGFERVRDAEHRHEIVEALPDAEVTEALAGAATSEDADPYLVNILATEATNRVRRLALTMHHVGEGIVALDAGGRVRFMNPQAEDLLGWTERALWGKDFHDAVKHQEVEAHHTLDGLDNVPRPREACTILNAMRTGERVHRVDHDVFETRDGRRFFVEFTAVPVIVEEFGSVDGVVVLFQDDTERIRREDTLRVFRATTENAAHGVMWLREDGGLAYVNRCATDRLGYSQDELKDMSVTDVDAELTPEEWSETWATVKAHGVVEVETVHRRKDGGLEPVSVIATHVTPEGAQEPFHLAFIYYRNAERKQIDLRKKRDAGDAPTPP